VEHLLRKTFVGLPMEVQQMSTSTLWDGVEPGRRENAPLLISAEAQAGTLGDIVAWVGLAIWGGALVAFVVFDIARTYQHHHAVSHRPRHRRPGRHQDAR
jgi:hypothetical protein